MKRFSSHLTIAALLLFVAVSGPSHAGSPVTLYRDTWGVPHIYAGTLAEAAYAMGYAQAEDRLDDIYLNVRTAVGTLAEVVGKDAAGSDCRMRLVDNAGRCKKYWETTAPDEVRAIGDNFVRGIEAFLKVHPDKKSPYATDLYGWQCLAIGRAMMFNWPLDQIQEDLDHRSEAPPFSSNSFAVAPSRSADGSAILMTDPHLTWQGMAVFYEGRIHANDVEMAGYWLVGVPLPSLGHSGHVAWACTTGGPDTADVYMVKLNPDNPRQYQYDGEWKTFGERDFTVNVKGEASITKTALDSVYGPVWEDPDPKKGIAYCGASRYIESTGLLEQCIKMVRATSCDEFAQALNMGEYMEQNISFADTGGHIMYVRNGAVPKRPAGYNWNAPVPGGTSASRWLGFHDIKELVQIKDPPQGYFQNCNCSPAVMMRDSPMTPEKYPDYIFNVSWDQQSPRGARLLELLDADDSVTREEAMAYTLNVYDLLSKPWQQALRIAVEAARSEMPKQDYLDDPAFTKTVETILAWDGQFVKQSAAAPIVKFWRLKCQDRIDTAAIADGKEQTADDRRKMLAALAETLADIKARYGGRDITWGDIKVVGRSGKLFPCDGADFGSREKKNYTQTPFVTGASDKPSDAGQFVARKGSSTIMLSFLGKQGVDSYSLVVWGQSADPASPHYLDQCEKLYSQRKFKPTWFKKEDLLKHVESERTFTP